MSGTESNRTRRLLLPVLSVLVGLVAGILLLEIALWFLPVERGLLRRPVNASQPLLRFEPNRSFVYSSGPTFAIVTRGRVNNAGFVSDFDYDSTSRAPLLILVGDSFVESVMVPFWQTISGRLSAAAATRARVYNLGTSGAPLSQYLALADAARKTYHPDALAVIVVGNDFDESMLTASSTPGLHYFREDSVGRLVLHRTDYRPSRLRRLVRHSALIRYLFRNTTVPQWLWSGFEAKPATFVGNVNADTSIERMRASRRVVDEFLRLLPSMSGLAPSAIAIVVDGIRPQLYDSSALSKVEQSYFGQMRRYLLERAASAGYVGVDLQPILIERHRRDGSRFEFATDAHWNANGHEQAANAVMRTSIFRRLVDSTHVR